MFALERRRKIDELIKKEGRVTVEQLAETMDVSVVTIRRDLDFLEKEGMISRTFGGAVKRETISKEISYTEKENIRVDQKDKIAKSAAKYVKDDMVILLDAGTTTMQICKYLKKISNLTVITFDLRIAVELCNYPNITTIFIGGEVSQKSQSCTGVDTVFQLDKYNIDIAFIGCDSFNLSRGVFTTSQNRAYIKEKIMEISELSILLSTTDKFKKKTLIKYAYLDEFSQLIFDSNNQELIDELIQTELPYELI